MKERIKITVLILGMATTFSLNIQAQQVTYSHDASKMNQITVMEIGSGTLTPNTITGYYTIAIVRQPHRRTSWAIELPQELQLTNRWICQSKWTQLW